MHRDPGATAHFGMRLETSAGVHPTLSDPTGGEDETRLDIQARLRVGGGVTLLKFDDRCIGAAGGELDLQSRGYDGATDRYDVAVTGGANNATFDER